MLQHSAAFKKCLWLFQFLDPNNIRFSLNTLQRLDPRILFSVLCLWNSRWCTASKIKNKNPLSFVPCPGIQLEHPGHLRLWNINRCKLLNERWIVSEHRGAQERSPIQLGHYISLSKDSRIHSTQKCHFYLVLLVPEEWTFLQSCWWKYLVYMVYL